MKKIFFGILAIVAMVATSCQQEMDLGANGGEIATISVEVGTPQMRSFSDGEQATVLKYAVYDVNGNELFRKENEDIIGGRKSIKFDLATNRTYTIYFWAQAENAPYTFNGNSIEVDYTNAKCNDEKRDAFYGVIKNHEVKGAATVNVELKRPFAQVNVGASDFAEAAQSGMVPSTSALVVKNVFTTLNLFDGTASNNTDATFAAATIPAAGEAFPYNNAEYKYLAMSYVLVGKDESAHDVTYTINAVNGPGVERTIGMVPMRSNYRTNIYGKLLTNGLDVNIDVNPDYNEPDNNDEAPSTVSPANTAELQAALDSAVNRSTIQLKAGVNYGVVYLRPIAGSPATKIVDWVGNNYRWETYTLFENLTIIGAEGATIDAVVIEGGTYYHTNHSQNADYPVMLSLVELKNVVFDGVTFIGNSNHYGTDTHGNAVSLAGNNIKVDGLTFKNCVLKDDTNNNRLLYKSESTTHVHNYVYNDEAFTFTPSLKNITITDCTFDGGYMGLELREAENVTITNNEFKVADRNILLPVNSGYTYSGAITITGNTSINAKERFVRADGTGDAVVVIKNNRLFGYQGADADYIKVTNGNNVTIEDNECITGAYATVSTAEELASIINNATKDTTVVLAADLEGKIELWQNAAVNITINGNGKKYTGAIRIINIGGATDRSLTIKNINFDGTGITTSEGCIYTSLGVTVNGQGYNSYIANVTVENCHFTGDSTTAAFRQNNGGDINLTLKNCEVDSTMHSFVQAKNFKNTLTAVDCKVNSKNGVNLNNTHDASFTGCEFDVKGYAVRVGVNDNSDTVLKTYNFTSCTLKSECQDGDAVVIVRNTAKDATLTFVDCEVEGSTIISGITSDTIVNGIELPQLNNQIWYTATSLVHAHWYKDKFGVGTDLVSNVWDETTGKGVITLSGDVTKIGQNAFYYDGFHDSRENLISISLPSTVTEIGEAAFGHCPNLTTVTFNNNLVTIGPSAFIGCAKLTNVVLPESLVTIGDSAFNSCTSLKSITIPAGVTSIGNFAFNGISEIKVYCKPTTPPTVGSTPFNKWWAEIYVPTASLAAYQQAWGGVADNIYDGGF